MAFFRTQTVAFSIAMLTLYASAVVAGALRGCLPTQHTHDGSAAADCAMHHAPAQPDHAPAAEHAHHGNHEHAAPPMDNGPRVTCGCSDDVTAPYVGTAGMATGAFAVSPPPVSHASAAAGDRGPDDLRVSPPSPPPRLLPSRM